MGNALRLKIILRSAGHYWRCARSLSLVIAITGRGWYNHFVKVMRSPYGLNILDDCVACPVREEHLFCNLPLPVVHKLNDIKSTAIYPKSAVLFIEGQR